MTVSDFTSKHVFNYFEVIAGNSENMVVKVLDTHGRIAKTVMHTMEDDGTGKLCLNIDDLKKGKYVINIFSNDNFVKAVHYTKN